MTSKVIAVVLTLAANLAAGVIIFFFLLLALNGFSESDAVWGLGAFIIVALAITVLTSLAALLGTNFLLRKGFSGLVSVLILVSLCTIVGVIAELISGVIGIANADFVRRNY